MAANGRDDSSCCMAAGSWHWAICGVRRAYFQLGAAACRRCSRNVIPFISSPKLLLYSHRWFLTRSQYATLRYESIHFRTAGTRQGRSCERIHQNDGISASQLKLDHASAQILIAGAIACVLDLLVLAHMVLNSSIALEGWRKRSKKMVQK